MNINAEQLQAQLTALQEENARLKAARSPKPTLKVSDKGGISLYGIGRFPVTLYKNQWTTVLNMADEIRGFIADNEASLSVKPE